MRQKSGVRVSIAGAMASVVIGLAVHDAAPSVGATGPYAADVAPDLSTPMSLLDGGKLRAAIWQNFQKYVAGCMHAAGYTYTPAGTPPPSSSELALADVNPGGTTETFNAVTSAKYQMVKQSPAGQGIVSSNARGFMRALRGVEIWSDTPKALAGYDWRAYDGVSLPNFGYTAAETAGCEAEGRQMVAEPAMQAWRQVDVLAAPLLIQLMDSQEANDAEASWSSCMAVDGYTYESVDDPTSYLDSKAAALREEAATIGEWDALAAEEASIAGSSSTCMTTSGLESYIDTDVQASWESFRAEHVTTLQQAGGMTGAEAGGS